MTNSTIGELFGNQVLQSNPLATVTLDCIVIRNSAQRSHTILPLTRVSRIRRVTTAYPALLVFSIALFLVSAAAYYSKQGAGATLPSGLLGAGCVLGYQLTRRAAVSFVIGDESFETERGSHAQAAAVIAAIQSAQTCLQTPENLPE